jgi:PHD/YefM family antitoxin component YafN of YafNO toxin-antitoxin module
MQQQRSTGASFQTMRIDDDTSLDLTRLHSSVLQSRGRIELTNSAGDSCVLISKVELDALEKALEILSSTDEVKEMSEQLSRIVAVTTCAQ